MLQWERWLKSDLMEKQHVLRAEKKHRYLMHLIKRVSRRTAGMGLRIMKFHSIMHVSDDILNFGVPMEFDTGSNESGHKVTKTAARLTQRKEETFDQQTEERLSEMHLLELAQRELEGHVKWEYFECERRSKQFTQQTSPNILNGSKMATIAGQDGQKRLIL